MVIIKGVENMDSISKRRRIDKNGKEVISWMGQINTKGVRKTFYGKTKRYKSCICS